MRYIRTGKAPMPGGHYSQAVHCSGHLYISGQLPADPESLDHAAAAGRPFEVQVRRALTNLLNILESAGGTSGNLVKVTAYIVGVGNWAEFDRVYSEVLGAARPARAVVPVPALHYGYLVEIDAVAAGLPDD